MATLKLPDFLFDAELLVFDKDGTLINFHKLWGSRIISAVESMITACQGSDNLRNRVYRTIGYSLEQNQTLGCGPLATAPNAQLETIAATVLYQTGISWDDSLRLATEHFTKRMVTLPTADEISPRANLPSLLEVFRDAGIKLAVATTDDRLPTETCLQILGINNLIEQLLCGDDRTGFQKPDPAILVGLSKSVGVPVDKVIMVGDTVSDLKMAKAAGAMAIGITGGAGSREELEQQADVVIDSLEEISVA